MNILIWTDNDLDGACDAGDNDDDNDGAYDDKDTDDSPLVFCSKCMWILNRFVYTPKPNLSDNKTKADKSKEGLVSILKKSWKEGLLLTRVLISFLTKSIFFINEGRI